MYDDDNDDETKTDTENESEADTMLSIIKPIVVVASNCIHTKTRKLILYVRLRWIQKYSFILAPSPLKIWIVL